MRSLDTGEEACLLLEKKLNLFSQYLSTTEQMKAGLGNNGEKDLDHLLSKRQNLICKIEIIDMAIKRIHPTRSDKTRLIANKFRERINNFLVKLRDIMERVQPLDNKLMAMVRQESQSTKTDLLRRQKVRQAMRGYGSFRKYPAKFLDTHR